MHRFRFWWQIAGLSSCQLKIHSNLHSNFVDWENLKKFLQSAEELYEKWRGSNENEVINGWRETEAEESAFYRTSYERSVTWQSLWTCWYSKSNGSINSSAINRQAVRTAALKIDFLKFFWFMFFSFFITSIKSWIRKSKGKSRKIVLFLKNCELSKILQLCLKMNF